MKKDIEQSNSDSQPTKKRRFNVYVEFSARISTKVMATSKDEAKRIVDETLGDDLTKSLSKVGRRKFEMWELNGGVKRAAEIVTCKSTLEV